MTCELTALVACIGDNRADAWKQQIQTGKQSRTSTAVRHIGWFYMVGNRHSECVDVPWSGGDSRFPQIQTVSVSAKIRQQHVAIRLAVLQAMGSGFGRPGRFDAISRQCFGLCREPTIARRGSPVKPAAPSDRLRIVVTNALRLRESRVGFLSMGEEEQESGAGHHYMLLEGTDARSSASQAMA